jgi:hypothetical protein
VSDYIFSSEERGELSRLLEEALGAHGRIDALNNALAKHASALYGMQDELQERVDNTEAIYDKQAQFLAELERRVAEFPFADWAEWREMIEQRMAEHMTVTAREIIVLQQRVAALEAIPYVSRRLEELATDEEREPEPLPHMELD